MAAFKRILLKMSGESLMKDQNSIDPSTLLKYSNEIKNAADMGVETGIVIGGGNIFRGLKGAGKGFDRVKGDQMGMLATVINALALQSSLESLGARVRLFTAVTMATVGERFSQQSVKRAFDNGEIAIFSGGTGNPYFTTDTAAALRASEINADLLLKGTRVDGVYSADPETEPDAKKFERITYNEAYNNNLKIMDLTAFTLCRENEMKIVVFNMNVPGNLCRIISGEKVGTLIEK